MDIMDQTIILDCQTKSNTPCCESCVVYKECKTKKKIPDENACTLETAPIVSAENK